MNYDSMTKQELLDECKKRGVKGCSKKTKPEIISVLKQNETQPPEEKKEPVSTSVKKSKEKKSKKEPVEKETKPRVEKIDKRLAKELAALVEKTPALTEFKTEAGKTDVPADLILTTFSTEMTTFVDAQETSECKEFVDKFGALTLANYMKTEKDSNLWKASEEEFYKTLIKFLFRTNEKAMEPILKSVRSAHTKATNPDAGKKKSKKSSIRGSAPKKSDDDDDVASFEDKEESRSSDDELKSDVE